MRKTPKVNDLLALKALIEERMAHLSAAREFNWDSGAIANKNYIGSQINALVWARSMLVGVLCKEPPIMRAAVAILKEQKRPLRAAPACVYAGAR